MSEIDKKVVLTYIKYYFEYYSYFVNEPDVDEAQYLRDIIFFCEEYNYPALEIFILGSLASFRYPELQITTGWTEQQMIYLHKLCLSYPFDKYRSSDPVIQDFFTQLNNKIKKDRINNIYNLWFQNN